MQQILTFSECSRYAGLGPASRKLWIPAFAGMTYHLATMRRFMVPPATRRVGLGLLAGAIIASGACASRGKEVFIREGCVICHRFRELGVGGAPDLSEVGSRRDATWIRSQIVNPTAHDPAARMPPFPRITGFELWSLAAFLRD
jgi:mono/diheme cytochrome c family protein